MQAIQMRPGVDPYSVLETGNILIFPNAPVMPAPEDREFLSGIRQDGGAIHKNIAYRPARDQITGTGKLAPNIVNRLHAVLRTYSRAALAFAANMLPAYQGRWKQDYASFRPVEEQGRDLPFNKRNDLLHVDAFPTRPTGGGLILRIFTNINPSQSRVWITSDPFEMLAEGYARDAGLAKLARPSPVEGLKRAIGAVGLPVTSRSPYDRFMLAFHEYVKRNAEYQRTCAKYRFEFPPGATWMVFTDVVPHSVESGQLAMEQTVIVARESLAKPERAPIAILEKLAGTRLSA
jgi:3-deoxy-D-manno-oct-2-ulosonic acid (Kdo) hydroxylase